MTRVLPYNQLLYLGHTVITMKKIVLALLLSLVTALVYAAEEPVEITVYKSPYCGCCSQWAAHLRANGFSVLENKVNNVGDYKQQFGIPSALASCHTALVAGYVIEGHVPASDIRRLLREKPDILGLSVPGMVAGSPGMEQGTEKISFDVLAVRHDGTVYIYNSYK